MATSMEVFFLPFLLSEEIVGASTGSREVTRICSKLGVVHRSSWVSAGLLISLILPGCSAPAAPAGGASVPVPPESSAKAAPAASSKVEDSSPPASGPEVTQRILKEIQVTEQELFSAIFSALLHEYVALPFGATALKTNEAARVRLVSRLGSSLSGVIDSRAFRAAYAEQVASAVAIAEVEKPAPPRTAKEIHDKRIAEMSDTVRHLEELSKRLPALERKALDKELTKIKKELVRARSDMTPDVQLAAAEKEEFEAATKAYPSLVKAREEMLAKRRAAWPEDPNVLVARRLRDFLALSSTIRWDAQTSSDDGLVRFVDPELEAKDPVWKLCFRAGKPTVEAARAVAQNWLSRIEAR